MVLTKVLPININAFFFSYLIVYDFSGHVVGSCMGTNISITLAYRNYQSCRPRCINQVLKFPNLSLSSSLLSEAIFSWTILLHMGTSNVTFAGWRLRRITSTLIIWHIESKIYNWLNFVWSKTWKAMEEFS